jgi:putative endonuclease
MNKPWYVYMVRCNDNSLYTGITTDITRRVNEHNSKTNKAAKYTRSKQPIHLVYYETLACRSSASIKEAALKKLTKIKKETLVNAFQLSNLNSG